MVSCLVCRSRKIRCDGSAPHCRNCMNLGLQCPGYATSNLSPKERAASAAKIYQNSGRERRRVGACGPCRAAKYRCSRTRPSCQRCLTRHVECTYDRISEDKSADSGVEPTQDDLGSSSGREAEVSSSIDRRANQEEGVGNLEIHSQLYAAYFDRVHPLRCLGFIHKPSFMLSADLGTLEEDYDIALLDVMRALGARQIGFDLTASKAQRMLSLSQELADKARQRLFSQVHNPCSDHLKTAVLLAEYAHRAGQFAYAFILGGCMYRVLRLLGYEVLSDTEEHGHLETETAIRLVWACYIVDVRLSCGVDKIASWRDELPDLPLPCSEADFATQVSGERRYLQDSLSSPETLAKADSSTLIVVLMHLRKQVLRLIRNGNHENDIASPSSPFFTLLRQLECFHQQLVHKYALTDLNIYVHKDQHGLGALFALHLFYNVAICDLTRVSLPGFHFPLAAAFRHAPPDFIIMCQKRCQHHAEELSRILQRGKSHGRLAFDDTITVDAAFESTKIQIVTAAIIPQDLVDRAATKENIVNNLHVLNFLLTHVANSNPHIRTLLSLCAAFGFHEIVQEWSGPETLRLDLLTEIIGSAKVDHLSDTAPFRRALSETRAHQLSTSPRTVGSQPSERNEWRHEAPPIVSPITVPSLQVPMSGLENAVPNDSQVDGSSMSDLQFAQMSSQQYFQTAEELSDFLVWDVSEWETFGSYG